MIKLTLEDDKRKIEWSCTEQLVSDAKLIGINILEESALAIVHEYLGIEPGETL